MMHFRNKNSGLAIALAWPQTYCKQPGSWYDPVTEWLGINKNNYYRAGHAATVLIDIKKKNVTILILGDIMHLFVMEEYEVQIRTRI